MELGIRNCNLEFIKMQAVSGIPNTDCNCQLATATANYGLMIGRLNHTLTLNSLKASFKLVFKSVLDFRLPIIKAQLTPNEPAGKSLLYVPGITTLLAGTRPLYSRGV